MGDFRREPRFRRSAGWFTMEITTDRRRAHGRAITVRAAAEKRWCSYTPILPTSYLLEQPCRARTIPAKSISPETPRKGFGERILIDRAVLFEDLDYGERHVGIIRPWPGRMGQCSREKKLGREGKKFLSEGITDGESLETVQCFLNGHQISFPAPVRQLNPIG
jgi:hypothetical protein